jgi:hypothetical protein
MHIAIIPIIQVITQKAANEKSSRKYLSELNQIVFRRLRDTIKLIKKNVIKNSVTGFKAEPLVWAKNPVWYSIIRIAVLMAIGKKILRPRDLTIFAIPLLLSCI